MQLPNWFNQIFGTKFLKQLRRFLIIGGISTIISYSVFLFSIRVLLIHPILANTLAFLISIVFSYNLNKRWSFEVEQAQKSHAIGYALLYLSSLIVSNTVLKITIDFYGVAPELAFIISLFFTTTMNFLGTKFLVFKE